MTSQDASLLGKMGEESGGLMLDPISIKRDGFPVDLAVWWSWERPYSLGLRKGDLPHGV